VHPIKNLKKLRALNGSLHSWQGKRREHTHERARTHSDSKAECKEARDEAPDYTLELGIKHEVLLRAKRLTFLTPVRFTTTLFGARQIFQIFEKLDKHRQIKRDLKPEVPRLIRQLPRYFFRFPEICSSLSFLLTIRFWGQDDFQKLAMNKFPGLTKLTQSSQHGQSGHGGNNVSDGIKHIVIKFQGIKFQVPRWLFLPLRRCLLLGAWCLRAWNLRFFNLF